MQNLKILFAVAVLAGCAFGQQTGGGQGSSGGGSAFVSGAAGTGYQDIKEIAAPANPASGVERLYSNSTTHALACLTSSGGSCFPGGGAPAFSSITTGTNTAATMTVGSGGTLNIVTGAVIDFSALGTGSFKLPQAAGATASATKNVILDTTANVWHFFTNGADSVNVVSTATDTTTTHALFASATGGVWTSRAIATGDLPTSIPIGNVGSAGLSGTAPVAIASTGVISLSGAAGQVPNGATGAFTATPTLGANGGTGGSLTLAGSTSGSAAITVSAAGVLALPSGTTATNIALTTPTLGTPASGTLTNATGYLEQNLTGASAAGTITEGGATFSVTRAGVATAALTAPWVFQNTNSTNNNASITTIFNSPGTSIGQTTVNVNGTTTQGNLLEAGTGGAVAAGVLSGQTKVFQVAPTGALSLGTANCTTFGTAGPICAAEGTAPTNVANVAAIYPDSTAHELKVATNGSASFGQLVRAQPGSINQTAQTAAITTATLCAASAGACNVAGHYQVNWDFWGSGTACSSVTAGKVQFLLTWTDENAVTHSAVALQMTAQTGAATTAMQDNMPFQTALANEGGGGSFIFSTNGTIVQYATAYTACTTGTGTYGLRATVSRLQ